MFSLRDFWRKHKRKVLLSAGILGSGYVLYKVYDTYRRRISELENETESQREVDELIKAQLQTHFENIQRISDTMTLPYAMHYLRCRIAEELDLSHLTERLMQGKGQPKTLTTSEKLELWQRLKILSFTGSAVSLWAMTMLTLYIRVQVNILGRHLYIDTARDLGNSQPLVEADPFDRHGQQEFLATADFLSNHGLGSLILNMQRAAAEVLKEISLRDPFNTSRFCETIMRILELFMSIGGPQQWVSYLVPENALVYRQLMGSSNDFNGSSSHPDISKLDQLITETRAVLSSDDFRSVVEISLKRVVEGLVEEVEMQSSKASSASLGLPLAKFLPHVAQLGLKLLEDPSQNRYIEIIQKLPEVELFFTLLYANMPPLSEAGRELIAESEERRKKTT